MAAVTLTPEVLEERLQEAKRTYKLNVGYAGLAQLPAGFVELVKKYNPHIVELELSSNNLSDLPEDLGELQQLRILRLKYNQFKKLPSVLTRLPQLATLELGGNQVARVEDSIAHMANLKELDLSGNVLTELPHALGTLPKLEVLHLENNRLEALPDSIGDLPALIKLNISTNNLHQLPPSMGRMRRIQRIDAANNMLVRVPPSIGHLKTIKELNLKYNALDDRYKAKVEEGLSRLLAFLQDEEERERLEEIERLKPIGTPVGSYLEYRCKVELSQVHKSEYGDVAVDNRCWIRTGHTLTQVGNMLLLYGGILIKDGNATSDVFWMTTDRMEWHHQPCSGAQPPARSGHCAVYDEEHHRLVVFGGRGQDKKRLNDVYALDLETFKWSKPNCNGAPPPARDTAGAAYYAGNMLIFGGHCIGARTNDFYFLDLDTWSWSQPQTSGMTPAPRQGPAVGVGGGRYLFVHGGRNNFVQDDLHVLDLVTKVWSPVVCGGCTAPARHGHIMCMINDALYLFGGHDELGAHSFTMFRVDLPTIDVTTPGGVRGDWQELDCELPYNKSRTYAFHGGDFNIYQIGSTTLGRSNDEDADKGHVYWDVFKSARIENLREKQNVREDDNSGTTNAKRARVQYTINTAPKMPKSFTTQSAKETKLLAYVQDFKNIFQELYPHRRPLYLTPLNECGIPKFVCSTLRPTQLSYTELYDLKGCAQFVADFLFYEPLEDPLHPPQFLPSPMSALSWQAGDCFDMSTVLASLLIGVGYNAYVVVGYAPVAVTINDQSGTECPVLEAERSKASAARATTEASKPAAPRRSVADKRESLQTPQAQAQPPQTPLPGQPQGQQPRADGKTSSSAKYAVQPSRALQSRYQEAHNTESRPAAAAEASMHAMEAPAAVASLASMTSEPSAVTAATDEPLAATEEDRHKRVHAWVLVLAGKREVTEPVFIEPSTGRRYPLHQSPYEGVEYLWNHQNFWVCMQMPQPHSDVRADPKVINWDLTDTSKWESVFETTGAAPVKDVDDGAATTRATLEYTKRMNSMKSGPSGMLSASLRPKTPLLQGGLIPPRTPGTPMTHTARALGPTSATGSFTGLTADLANSLPRTPFASSHPGQPEGGTTPPRSEYAKSEYARSEFGDSHGGGEEEAGEQEFVPDLPPSWVPKLTIPRDAFDMRCPRGSKTTQYRQAQHEIFALYGECSRWDGLVERLTLFVSDERAAIAELRETFRRRKDKLTERRTYPPRDTVMEYFDPGSSFSIRDMVTLRGEQRIMNFYHAARLDGLVRREEQLSVKMIETFTGRSDLLTYRSAAYMQDKTAGAGATPRGAKDVTVSEQTEGGELDSKPTIRAEPAMLPLRKVTEKYERNPGKHADVDVAKRVFNLAEARIRVEYHFGEGNITNASKMFSKDGHSHIVQVDPLAEQPQASTLLEEYQALLQAEKDSMQAVRDSEYEVKEILRARATQEKGITLAVPHYDVVRVKAEESEDEEVEEAASTFDYLSPFLPALIGPTTLSRAQALDVRERCLRALKDRLVERANIIQARLEEENSSLQKRQGNYQRDRDQMTPEEEEEYERATEESMFKIQILEKRLKRHEEQALRRYYDLDRKLRHDSRLHLLTQSD